MRKYIFIYVPTASSPPLLWWAPTAALKLLRLWLSELDSLLRNINPYAKAYKMMYEVERKELERFLKIGCMPREVTMIIKRNDKLDKNR